MHHWEGYENDVVWWDISELLPVIEDPEEYINWMDMRFTHGSLSDHTRQVIRDVMNGFEPYRHGEYAEWRTGLGLYMLLISPDYAIFR